MRLLSLAALLLLAAAGRAAAQDVVVSTGEGKGYSWTVTVPRLGVKAADATLDGWAAGQLKEFVSVCRADEQVTGKPGEWQFILSASTFPPAGPYSSARLDAWSYTGGAHGNTASESFVFERRTGRRLALADLFAPGAKYLEELSRRVRPELKRSLGEYGDPEWIKRGTEPTAENYALFALVGDRLFLFFPAYQVGPYVSGPQTVRLPLSSLRAILRPELTRP